MDELEAAARRFVRAVEAPNAGDPYREMVSALTTLLGVATASFALANEGGPMLEKAVAPPRLETKWPPSGRSLPDEFRQTMHAVYQDEYCREGDVSKESVSREIGDLYSMIAVYLRAIDGGADRRMVLRTLAYDCDADWGVTAALLVRPLWELMRW